MEQPQFKWRGRGFWVVGITAVVLPPHCRHWWDGGMAVAATLVRPGCYSYNFGELLLWSFPPVLMFATAVSRAACNRYCIAGPPPRWSCVSSDLFPPVLVHSWIKVEWIWQLHTHLCTWTDPTSKDGCSCVYHVDMYVFTVGLFEPSPDQFLYMNYAYFLVKQLLYHSDLIFYLWVTQLLYGPISMRLSSASSWKSRN
jgi:hypothetical protein